MMKAKRIKKWLMGLTVAAAIALQGMTALAATGGVQNYDPAKKGTIKITPKDQLNDTLLPVGEAGTYSLYRVGDVKPGTSVTEFTLTDAFLGSGETIDREALEKDPLDNPEVPEIAEKLANYAVKNTIPAFDGHDAIKFDESVTVPEGLYLVRQNEVGDSWHKFRPFMIIMPEGSKEGDGYLYDVTCTPKTYSLTPVESDPPVEKIIVDNNGNNVSRSDKFKFTMTPSAGAPMPEGTPAGTPKTVVAGAGGVEFGVMTFTKAGGPYTYTFTEEPVILKEYTRDTAVYTITINVVRNADDNLEVQRTITKNGTENVDKVLFTNVYTKREWGGSSSDDVTPSGGSSTTPETEPGRVLGVHRDGPGSGPADAPAGRVLGASRRARTGDSSNMMLYGAVFCGAVVLLGVWGVSKKRKKDADQS